MKEVLVQASVFSGISQSTVNFTVTGEYSILILEDISYITDLR